VNADVPSFVTELAKKAVEGMDVEELVSEVKEMLEKGIIKRKTMRKPPGEPEYISFTTDDKWKRF
jgi:DNA-binding HxlR family transcriptional regulator